MHVRLSLILPVLLAVELTLRCQMCDLHFKFEEDRTKSADVPTEQQWNSYNFDRQTGRLRLET